MKLIKLFDGKKTAIGAGCLLVAGILGKLDISGLSQAIEILEYIGMAFSGLGLGHKVKKAKK